MLLVMIKRFLFWTLILFVLYNIWNEYVSTRAAIGIYVNNNTDFVLEGPRPIENGVDTLYILENGLYNNNVWGSGTYELHSSILGSEIHLNNDYSGCNLPIDKTFFGQTRIWLDLDLHFYYIKVD